MNKEILHLSSRTEIAIYIEVCDVLKDGSNKELSPTTIASKLGTSDRTVSRVLEKLVKCKHIVRVDRGIYRIIGNASNTNE